MRKKLIIFCLTLAAAATLASAEKITYVDATHGPTGNTRLASGGVWDLDPNFGYGLSTDNSGTDNLWRLRTGFGNPEGAGAIYEAGGTYSGDEDIRDDNPEDCPRLVTTVSGLPMDTYNVYAYFWCAPHKWEYCWRIRAGLMDMAGQLPFYYSQLDRDLELECPPIGDPPAALANPGSFEGVPLIIESWRELWQAYLGTVTGTGFSVYIDDDPAHGSPTYRTWYDGVGYIPEPTTVVLLGLGGMALLRKKSA